MLYISIYIVYFTKIASERGYLNVTLLLFLRKHRNKKSHQMSLYSRLLTWDNWTTVDMGTGEEPFI